MSQPNQPEQPEVRVTQTPDYRSSYANSVHVRMSVWDFQLTFGTMHQAFSSNNQPADLEIQNFQGVYLSPQQAKALWNILGHNLAQYEQTFGAIALEPKDSKTSGIEVRFPQPGGPVN